MTHQGGDGTSCHTYPPYNMPIFTQFEMQHIEFEMYVSYYGDCSHNVTLDQEISRQLVDKNLVTYTNLEGPGGSWHRESELIYLLCGERLEGIRDRENN